MQDDDDDNSTTPLSAETFIGLPGEVKKYKTYINRLKRGASSGISGRFGRALDLLPPDQIQPLPPVRTYEIGESILSHGAGTDELRQVIEDMIESYHADIDETQVHHQEDADLTVIGVFVEGGQKKYLLSDYSIVDAPEDDDQTGEEDASPVCEEPVIKDSDISDSELEDFRDDETSSYDEVDSSDLETSSRRAPDLTPDLRVTDAEGSWLWDVALIDGQVAAVTMADGTTIIKTTSQGKFVKTAPAKAGEDSPDVELVDAVSVDGDTGNLCYTASGGSRKVIMMNSGWMLEISHQSETLEEQFIVEPLRSGQAQCNRIPVKDIEVDEETGDYYCKSIDGGVIMVMRARRLNEPFS